MKVPHNSRLPQVSPEQAEELGVSVLVWLSGQPDLMSRFLAISGIEAGQIREAAAAPGFMDGVLAFIMNHEPTLMRFCEENGTEAAHVQACYRQLAGPGEGVWL